MLKSILSIQETQISLGKLFTSADWSGSNGVTKFHKSVFLKFMCHCGIIKNSWKHCDKKKKLFIVSTFPGFASVFKRYLLQMLQNVYACGWKSHKLNLFSVARHVLLPYYTAYSGCQLWYCPTSHTLPGWRTVLVSGTWCLLLSILEYIRRIVCWWNWQ